MPGEVEEDQLLLLREMHHRFANSFAVLAGMLRRELAFSALPDLRQSLDRFEARVVALGDLHRFLTIGAETDWISVQSYIEQLCEALSQALLKPLGVRCEVSADAAFFPSEYCELLGLVIAELVTNAAKHAFGGRNNGVVRIEFICTTDAWTCVVCDNGAGNSTPSMGVGSRILAKLARALGAELVRQSGPKGTSCTLRSPFHPEFCLAPMIQTCAD
jgi:two-component sensor histidine kinase